MSGNVLPDEFSLEAYFERIGYRGPRAATAAVLTEIQRRHVYTIPFENLDIQLGRPVRIDLPSVTRKLIVEKRGGYCFEQNALLRAALRTLGFKVNAHLGRIRWLVPAETETALTHMVLSVELDGDRWLVDAGLGSGSLTGALRIDTEEPQPTPHEPRRVVRRDGWYFQQTSMTGEWCDLYQFSDRPSPEIDFVMGNWYTSTFPQSNFVLNVVVARADEGVRYSVRNQEFITRHTDGRVEKRVIASPAEFLELLEKYFHLSFPAGTRFGLPR